MFYPVDSLRRGGRFYLCWVADWRPAAITLRQLWSQDIRQLSDNLLEVVTTESGQTTKRFSLRLSSQLMRGLVRLYERKASHLLREMCMINAHVFNYTNKKLVPTGERPPRRLRQLPAAATGPEQPPDEPRVEEMLQNSGNVVANIQDITLKEAAIPDFQLPPNDNFGEVNPEQNLLQAVDLLLADRSVELMMQETSGAHTSALGLPHDQSTDKSQDKSRPVLEAPQMESIAELDVTMFRKSTTEEIPPAYQKDAAEVPDVPEVPPLAPPVPDIPPFPILNRQASEQEREEMPAPTVESRKEVLQPTPPSDNEQELAQRAEKEAAMETELEELEERPLTRKRRGRTSLIIDKKIKLASDYLRARIDNPHVEMSCEKFRDAVIVVRVPHEVLLGRAAHEGTRFYSAMSPRLMLLFQRNLRSHGAAHAPPTPTQEQGEEAEQLRQRRTRSFYSASEKIPEAQEVQAQLEVATVPTEHDTTSRPTEHLEQPENITLEVPNVTLDVANVTTEVATVSIEAANVTVGAENVTADPLNVLGDVPNVDPTTEMQVDIADLPTQKLETLSQAKKRASEMDIPTKKLRSGEISLEKRQKQSSLPKINVTAFDGADKENIEPNVEHSQAEAARLLAEAGLADKEQPPTGDISGIGVQEPAGRRRGSSGSETPLGSLDRTKVSLGDSVRTTDSQRFMQREWGTQGTMMKVINAVHQGGPVTIWRLVRACRLPPGPHVGGRFIAARCFASLLRLKQNGFVIIIKDPETLEIRDVKLGPRFEEDN